MSVVAELGGFDRDVPVTWPSQPLARLCTEVIERVDPASLTGSAALHYVGLEHIGQGTGRLDDNVGLVADVVSQKSRFRDGDILFGKLRPNLRKVARPDFGGVCSTDVIVFRTKANADPDFLFYVLQTELLVTHAVATAAGTKMPRTHARSILSFEIGVPPLDEQRRIAEVLRSVDDLIELTDATLTTLRATKQAVMMEALNRSFPEIRLGELLSDTRHPMRSGPFGSALLKAELQPDGIPFLGIDNVHIERFVPAYKRFISDEKYRELARYTVFPDDVMVTIMGTVGRSCVVPKDIGTAISSKHVWALTLDKARYSPTLLAWQINHAPGVLAQLEGSAQGGIMSAISSATLRDLLVPLPSPSEIREIEQLLASFNDQLAELEAELEQANHVKASLMSDLLSGRVRVPQNNVVPMISGPNAAFKRAVFAAEIVHQLHNDNRFGSVKHEKIVHLCELHLDLHDDLDRHAYKEAAGPYDPKARRSVEGIFAKQKWFKAHKPDGKRVVYTPLEKCGAHKSYFDRYFSSHQLAIQSIIDLLRPLDTERCEIVATLYAVWNDFLIDGIQPTDDAIVASVLQWHPKKATIAESRWFAALPWMRDHGLIATGKGEKTRVTAK